MPITKSAIKAMKQTRKANERNKAVKVDFKLKTKAVRKDVADGAKAAGRLFSLAVQSIDKAAKTGVIHKNTAARKKSRLVKELQKVTGKNIEPTSVKAAAAKPKPKTTAKKTTKKEA